MSIEESKKVEQGIPDFTNIVFLIVGFVFCLLVGFCIFNYFAERFFVLYLSGMGLGCILCFVAAIGTIYPRNKGLILEKTAEEKGKKSAKIDMFMSCSFSLFGASLLSLAAIFLCWTFPNVSFPANLMPVVSAIGKKDFELGALKISLNFNPLSGTTLLRDTVSNLEAQFPKLSFSWQEKTYLWPSKKLDAQGIEPVPLW